MRVERAALSTKKSAFPSPGKEGEPPSSRVSVMLRIWDSEGTTGLGEAAPLPGYSPDHLDGVRAALGAKPWTDLLLDESAPVGVQVRYALARVDPGVPSARFALETALLDLIARKRRCPLWALLSTDGNARPVPVALVLPRDHDVAEDAAEEAMRLGFRTLKVKVGHDLDRDLRLLERLRKRGGSELILRIDGNGSLPEEDLPRLLSAFARLEPEYVEEPAGVESVLRLPRIPVPLALDESLWKEDAARLFQWVGAEQPFPFVVLKPTTMGGVLQCAELARRARARGARAVLSHTFEGPVARAAAAALAVVEGGQGLAAGLGPHPGLDIQALSMMRGAAIVPWDSPGLGLH